MSYPKNLNLPPQEHLLFDIGYSYALLRRCHHVLSMFDDFEECVELAEEIDALMAGRQQTTTEIYDAADQLFEKLKTRD